MRYEVKVIGSNDNDDRPTFGALVGSTDDAAEAKRLAQEHCWDGEYGTAIIDTVQHTADLGDEIVAL